jgi:HAD superfamily hydrolase (TIGR01509 family)
VNPPPRAAAVLFDMDGLLVDSEPVGYAVEAALVERLGGVWSREHQEKLMGGTLASGADYIARLTGTTLPVDAIVDELLVAMRERFAAGVPTQPGAIECVDAVRAAGVPTALVTSTYRSLLDAALAGLGPHRFAVTVAGDEVTAGKPDPAPYLLACNRLGVDPVTCVVVEDALTGVRSAEAAGCTVLVVPSAPVEPAPRRHIVETLAGIDVDWLLTLPTRRAA